MMKSTILSDEPQIRVARAREDGLQAVRVAGDMVKALRILQGMAPPAA